MMRPPPSIWGACCWLTAAHCGRRRGIPRRPLVRTSQHGHRFLATRATPPMTRSPSTMTRLCTAGARGATVVIPPATHRRRPSLAHGPRGAAVARAGSDDHVGAAARPAPVEEGVRVPSSGPGGEHVLPLQNASIIGDGLRARSPAGQGSEAVLGCEILNRMTALVRPVSYRLGR